MKVLFAREGEVLVCTRCGSRLDGTQAYSEDGDLEFPWCEGCMDFVSPKVASASDVSGIAKPGDKPGSLPQLAVSRR